MLVELARPEERLEHRRLRLLELEEQGIRFVATEEKDDPGTRPHAAHADHLACGMHVAVALEQRSPVVRERAAVRGDHVPDRVLEMLLLGARQNVLDGGDERRATNESELTVDRGAELGERTHAVLRSRRRDLALEPPHLLRGDSRAEPGDAARHVEARVPDVEVPHRREVRHRLAVLPDGVRHHGTPRALVVAELPTGDCEARREALDVPLERAAKRLVEVVDREDQSAVGCGEHTEVRQVRVAAELSVQTGARTGSEIRGHEKGAAAIEGEGRLEHAAVADRDELWKPGLGLLLEELDRIPSQRCRLPAGVNRSRQLGPGGPSTRHPLGRREVWHRVQLRREGCDDTRLDRTEDHRSVGLLLEMRHGTTPPCARERSAASPTWPRPYSLPTSTKLGSCSIGPTGRSVVRARRLRDIRGAPAAPELDELDRDDQDHVRREVGEPGDGLSEIRWN